MVLQSTRDICLEWLKKEGATITGSVLNVGSEKDIYGHDDTSYKSLFPNASSYRTLDKEKFANIDVVADVQNMPSIPSNSEDCIVAIFMLCVVENLDKAMSEFKRVLKPNGVLLATFLRGRLHKFELGEGLPYMKKYFKIETILEHRLDDVKTWESHWINGLVCTFVRGKKLA